jgi:tetratricopeptide (TPR) repeat protein
LREEPGAVIQELIAGLDAWMMERREQRLPEATWRRLFRVADRLDHSDRSRRLRAILIEGPVPGAATVAGLREVRKDIDPRTEPVLTVVLLSRAYHVMGDAAGAEEVLRQAATARPDQVVLLNELANHLGRQPRARLEEAIGYYRAARGLRRGLGIGLSWALTRAGRPAQGEEVLRELAPQQPGNLAVHFHLASNLTFQEKYGEAEGALRKTLELKPDFAEVYSNLGNNLCEQRKYGEAETVLRKAIELKPDLAPAHLNLGVALHARQRDGEAEAAYRNALDLKPDFAEAYINLGHILRHRGKRDEGEAAYRKAVDFNPNLAVAHSNLGNALFDRGKHADAEAEFRKAVQLKPSFPLGYYGLGNALLGQRKHAEAEAAYRTALDRKPDFAQAYLNLGTALQEQGKAAEGEAAYRKALDLKPDLADAYQNLALALMRRAQFHEAATLLKKCTELVSRMTAQHDEVQRRLRLCERFVALDARLPAILSGTEQPATAAEQLEFAQLCLLKKLSAAAARLYADAFAMAPQSAADFRAGHRYHAACAAAQTGCARSEDGADLSDAERTRWHTQARQWLRADLAAWIRILDANPAYREAVRDVLTLWRSHPELACVRDPGELNKLPADERKEYFVFWAEVDSVLARTK